MLKSSIITMSETRSIPYENTIAFGGVETGKVNASEQANTVGNISANGFISMSDA